MKGSSLPEAFIEYTSQVIGDTQKGLNREEIVKQFVKYSIQFNVNIPVATTDWGNFGSKVPNKHTAIRRNLMAFNKSQQIAIIEQLCSLESLSGNDDIKNLRTMLSEHYSMQTNVSDLDNNREETAVPPVFDENSSRVFISYSWDSEEHKRWVKNLADKMREDGIDTYLDQDDLDPGDRLPAFMEENIQKADYVVMICTPHYKEKADTRSGGAGYEGNIISGELFSKHNEKKYIPIVRSGNPAEVMPTFLSGKLAIILDEGASDYQENYNDLKATLRGERKKVKHMSPKRITSQDSTLDNKSSESETADEISIEGIITDEVTLPSNDGTRGSALYKVPFRLSQNPSSDWKQLFISSWNSSPSFTTMHRPGIASVVGDKIILDGTTIEEVRDYHRDTLILCVKEANEGEKKIRAARAAREQAAQTAEENHFKNVQSIAANITF